jgi:hypothetical protein
MEHILALYGEPPNPDEPLICMDEKSKELHQETRALKQARPHTPRRRDYEYVRNGTRNIFCAVAPHEGKRVVTVTTRRTKSDFATFIRTLLDVHYPTAKKIHIVLDNLNIHGPQSLYATFTQEEAERLLNRIVFHHTPKHASWLNMAEIELSVLSTQCINGRMGTQARLTRYLRAWETARNKACAKITV